ncbi:MAG: hypothetical protein IKW89_14485 [Bacteroidales bacterium]|nr:hypothetical protein [Bacteroidales bacterium]
MDIDLFSNIVKDLILDNDEVTLPGLGTFVSELMPSTFSDKGYTINPPYRRLSFRQRWKENDSLLVDFYSETNGIEKSQAADIVGEFVSGLKETLQSKKLIVLPGLGRLRATKENAFFFIADEDLDIYPGGFGLEPVSLKTHEETPEEVTAAVKELQDALSEEEAVKTVEAVKAPRKRRPWLVAVIGTVASVILFLGLFMLLARIAPDFIDKILYSEEELRIINY